MARRRGVVLLLVFLVASAALGTEARAVDGPTLTPGDYWTYASNTTVTGGFYLKGSVMFQVAARESQALEGTTVDVFNVSVNGEGVAGGSIGTPLGPVRVTGSWTLTGMEWVDSSGLKVVRSVLDLRADGSLHTEPLPQDITLRVQNTTTFRVLDDRWRFPVDVGDTGTVRSHVTTSADFYIQYGLVFQSNHTETDGDLNLTYALETQTSVAVPAGTFDAYRVRETWPDGSYDLLYFAPAVGNGARSETHNDSGALVAQTNLAAYRYQVLEPPRFLGLDLAIWWILGPVLAASAFASVAFVVRRRRRNSRSRIAEPTRPPEGP